MISRKIPSGSEGFLIVIRSMKPLLAAVLLLGAPAMAEGSLASAKAHFQKGKAYYQQARYREAIAEFEAAYRAHPHGVLQYNIGSSYEKLGEISNALKSFHSYLRQVPNAED